MSYLRRGAGVVIRREPTPAQMRKQRYSSCRRKVQYTIEEAEAQIASATTPLTFYKCRFCDGHHLTSRTQAIKKAP